MGLKLQSNKQSGFLLHIDFLSEPEGGAVCGPRYGVQHPSQISIHLSMTDTSPETHT